MTTIAFTVPGKTVSTNATYLRGRGRRLYKSPEAEAFRTRLQYAARKAMRGGAMLTGPVWMTVRFFFDSDRPDIDGPCKPVLDALQGIVYANDRKVRRLVVDKEIDRESPRVEIEVMEVI